MRRGALGWAMRLVRWSGARRQIFSFMSVRITGSWRIMSRHRRGLGYSLAGLRLRCDSGADCSGDTARTSGDSYAFFDFEPAAVALGCRLSGRAWLAVEVFLL